MSSELNLGGTLSLQPGGAAWNADNTRPQLKREANGELRISSGKDSASHITFHTNTSNLVSSTEKVRIQNDGNVGIGTTTPSRALHVVGGIYASNASGFGTVDTTALVNILGSGATSGSSALRIRRQGGDELLRTYDDGMITMGLISSANIGIGTTSPSSKLEIVAANSTSALKLSREFSGTVYNYGEFINSGSDFMINGTANIFLNADSDSDSTSTDRVIKFGNRGVEYARIQSDGNVGIGNASPAHILDLTKTSDTGERAIRIQNSSALLYVGVEGSSGNRFVGSSTDNAFIGTTGSDGLELATNNSVRMVIQSDGNLGIGTTSPGALLEVAGVIKSSSTSRVQADTFNNSANTANIIYRSGTSTIVGNNANALVVLDGGSIGIGTTSPSYKLDVTGDASFNGSGSSGYVYIRGNSGLGGSTTPQYRSGMIFGWNRSNGYGESNIIFTDAGAGSNVRLAIQFWNNTTLYDYVSVNSSGNVGIGSTGPINRLQVVPSTSGGSSSNASEDAAYFGGNELGGVGGYTGIRLGGFGTSGYGTYIRSVKTTSYGNYWNEAITFSVTRTNTSSTVDEVMRITSGGNVGIGTTSPINTFHVVGQSVFDNNSSNINIKNTWSSGNHDINFIGGSTSGGSANNTAARIRCLATAPGGAATGDLTFTVNSGDTFVDALYIQEDGNVGIGTLSPGYKLEVITPDNSAISVRATSASHGILIGGAAFSTSNAYMGMKTSYMTGVNDYMIISGISDGNTYVSAAANMATHIRGGGNDTNNQIIVRDSSYNTYDAASYHQFSGSVGIGGTPSQKLHVVGKALITDDVQLTGSNPRIDFNSNGASSLRFYDTTNAAERARFNTDGNLGIGTTSPSSTLHVVDGTSGASAFKVDGTSGTIFEVTDDLSSSLMSVNTIAGLPAFEVFADYHIVAGRYNQNDFYLDTNGNLGLGTATPKAPLHVGDGSAGNYFGGKTFSLSNTFADALSITLPDDTACYVKLFVNGNWSGHSSVAFVAEYFIQNGGNSYNEPGLIIAETDNTFNGTVTSQIVDSTTDTFVIQIKLSTTGSFTANLSYQVMGAITSIS